MKNIQVFDPALCCSSGVCGTDVDQKLVDFSADVDWARQHGAQIKRFNLAQQPMAFANEALIKDLLQQQGEAALPVILVDGKVGLSGSYPSRAVLAGWLGVQLDQRSLEPAASSAASDQNAKAMGCCGASTAEATKPVTKCC